MPTDSLVLEDYKDEEKDDDGNGEHDDDEDTYEEVEYITHIESSDA